MSVPLTKTQVIFTSINLDVVFMGNIYLCHEEHCLAKGCVSKNRQVFSENFQPKLLQELNADQVCIFSRTIYRVHPRRKQGPPPYRDHLTKSPNTRPRATDYPRKFVWSRSPSARFHFPLFLAEWTWIITSTLCRRISTAFKTCCSTVLNFSRITVYSRRSTLHK